MGREMKNGVKIIRLPVDLEISLAAAVGGRAFQISQGGVCPAIVGRDRLAHFDAGI